MVTAELAIGLLTVALVLMFTLSTVVMVAQHAQCSDAATQIARAVARADHDDEQQARRGVPKGAVVKVEGADGWVKVSVTRTFKIGPLGPFTDTSVATMPLEPGVTEVGP